MNKIKKIADGFDRINEKVGKAISWLTTLLVLVICYDVTMRYVFNTTSVWVVELEWHLFSFIFLAGAGFALKHDRHVRVDIFYTRMPQKGRAWVNLIGILVFLLPFCLVTIYQSGEFALNAWQIGERSSDPGGLPARYLVKSAIPIGFTLLLVQTVSMGLHALLTILQPKADK